MKLKSCHDQISFRLIKVNVMRRLLYKTLMVNHKVRNSIDIILYVNALFVMQLTYSLRGGMIASVTWYGSSQ